MMALTRRSFLAAASSAASLDAATRPPNVILMMADDLGYADISSYGATDIRTPHIDAIGKQGVRFARAYCNAPECTPSRTALLTGRYQQRVGGMECAIGVGNVGRYDEAEWLAERENLGLPQDEFTVARVLKWRGYDTACFGKWHLGYLDKFSPNKHGFDDYFGVLGGNADYHTHTEQDGTNVLSLDGKPVRREGYLTDLIGTSAVNWLKTRAWKKNPFFLYVPFTAPHSPYQGRKDREGGYAKKPSRKTYAEMVEAMDQQVGAIMAQLNEMKKVAANTWVIFLSDNGGTQVGSNKPFRGSKSSLWEGGIRTPCLMRWPGRFRPGSETRQVSLMMDITASILAAANVRMPQNRRLDGLNLLPIWQGRRNLAPRTVYWRYRRAANTRKAVLDGDWKYVWDNGKEELHNLAEDMVEQNNRLTAEPGITAELKRLLARWEDDVRAPRLKDFYSRGKA
ncbi:MAG: sulfatase-like hydrolase/transferase [Bryobacteraceae bacterium]|nr:sulfatase-like hydrolase/transferase [Bryobacteraceae bacterium]